MKLRPTLLGILVVAVVSTLGDFVWYRFSVQHRMAFGVLHGIVLLAAVGGVLGAAAGRLVAGLPLGMAAGLGGALAYYGLAPLIGPTAVVAAWAVLWLLLAFLDGRVLQRGARSVREICARGLVAALLGGGAFALVVGTLWGRQVEGLRDYAVQLAAWAFAWAPGIVALTWTRREVT